MSDTVCLTARLRRNIQQADHIRANNAHDAITWWSYRPRCCLHICVGDSTSLPHHVCVCFVCVFVCVYIPHKLQPRQLHPLWSYHVHRVCFECLSVPISANMYYYLVVCIVPPAGTCSGHGSWRGLSARTWTLQEWTQSIERWSLNRDYMIVGEDLLLLDKVVCVCVCATRTTEGPRMDTTVLSNVITERAVNYLLCPVLPLQMSTDCQCVTIFSLSLSLLPHCASDTVRIVSVPPSLWLSTPVCVSSLTSPINCLC